MNVLYIIDGDHLRFVVVVDHSTNFKGIYSVVNTRLMGHNMESGGIQKEGKEIRKEKES